jgi:hypothetical protein
VHGLEILGAGVALFVILEVEKALRRAFGGDGGGRVSPVRSSSVNMSNGGRT